jgi:hypothetical protein
VFPSPSFPSVHPFGNLPVLRNGGQWLLTSGGHTVPADEELAVELDRFAVAMAAADQAVAALSPRPGGR